MKAFLLAAGHGTRLKPLTDKTPKCLLPVCGVPMLQIWLDALRRFGVSEVLINVHTHAGMIRDFVQGHPFGDSIRVVEEQELLGSAGTLLANRHWVECDDCFWVFYADVLHQVNLSEMMRLHTQARPAATIASYRVPDPWRCGVLTIADDGKVTDFIEKPSQPASDNVFAGLLIGTRQLLDVIPSKQPADLGFDVLPRLSGKMLAYSISNYLLDIGTLENYELAQRTWVPARNDV